MISNYFNTSVSTTCINMYQHVSTINISFHLPMLSESHFDKTVEVPVSSPLTVMANTASLRSTSGRLQAMAGDHPSMLTLKWLVHRAVGLLGCMMVYS